MILSDRDIRAAWELKQDLDICPYHPDQVEPAGYDIRLGDEFTVYRSDIGAITVDPRTGVNGLMATIVSPTGYSLKSQGFVLGTTHEIITIGSGLIARLEGRSSLARMGLMIHAVAGYIDPGFQGQITLEFYNISPVSILLPPGLRVGQLSFSRLTSACEHPYGSRSGRSKYWGQVGATASRIDEDREFRLPVHTGLPLATATTTADRSMPLP